MDNPLGLTLFIKSCLSKADTFTPPGGMGWGCPSRKVLHYSGSAIKVVLPTGSQGGGQRRPNVKYDKRQKMCTYFAAVHHLAGGGVSCACDKSSLLGRVARVLSVNTTRGVVNFTPPF